jgi:hypothetical protein
MLGITKTSIDETGVIDCSHLVEVEIGFFPKLDGLFSSRSKIIIAFNSSFVEIESS